MSETESTFGEMLSSHTHTHTHTETPKVMDGMFSVPSHQFRETSESEPMVSELYS